MGIFDDLTSVPAIALDYRFAGLVRLCGMGIPAKWIETRGTRTKYRGPVAIYATHGQATKNDEFLSEWFDKTRQRLVPDYVSVEVFNANTSRTMCGKVIALATISSMTLHSDYYATRGACVGKRTSDKGSNHVAWRLSNIWPLETFTATPAPGFFRVPAADVRFALARWFAFENEEFLVASAQNASSGILFRHGENMLRDHDSPGLGARWSSL